MPSFAGAVTGAFHHHNNPGGGNGDSLASFSTPSRPNISELAGREETEDRKEGEDDEGREQPNPAHDTDENGEEDGNGLARSNSKGSSKAALASRWTDTFGVKPTAAPLEDTRCSKIQALVRHALESPWFDFALGMVIIANAANIGFEQSYRKTGEYAETASTLEHVFLSIYTAELAARLLSFGLSCLHDGWVVFDTFLVGLGILTQWIIQPIFGDIDEVGPLMVLRTARLLRLAKTVRLLIRFRELWMLVRGLLSSANTMLYTLLMLFVIIYIFACLGMELLYEHPRVVGPDRDEEFAKNVDMYFRSLPIAMLSLLQFVCFDNIVLIYRPLCQDNIFLMCYFILLILVVGIVVMNLVTAVIVNSALEQTAQDKDLMKSMEEKRKKKILKDLKRMFTRLDEDGSGQLSREEIEGVDEAEKEVLRNLTSMDDPVEIFDVLDVDGSGDIGIDEFCDGLWQVAISNAPLEIKRMEKQVERIRMDTKVHGSVLTEISAKLDRLNEEIAMLSTSTANHGRESGEQPCPCCGCHRQHLGDDDKQRLIGPDESLDNLETSDDPQELRASVVQVLRELGISSRSLKEDAAEPSTKSSSGADVPSSTSTVSSGGAWLLGVSPSARIEFAEEVESEPTPPAGDSVQLRPSLPALREEESEVFPSSLGSSAMQVKI